MSKAKISVFVMCKPYCKILKRIIIKPGNTLEKYYKKKANRKYAQVVFHFVIG